MSALFYFRMLVRLVPRDARKPQLYIVCHVLARRICYPTGAEVSRVSVCCWRSCLSGEYFIVSSCVNTPVHRNLCNCHQPCHRLWRLLDIFCSNVNRYRGQQQTNKPATVFLLAWCTPDLAVLAFWGKLHHIAEVGRKGLSDPLCTWLSWQLCYLQASE